LRAIRLKQTGRGTTTYGVMRAMGLSHSAAAKVASHGGSWWAMSHHAINRAMPNAFFDALGLPRLERSIAHGS
jgi:hypothetical protein